MSKYERFEMQPKETIQEMFTRFTNITNELVSLGRIIPSDEQVREIPRSMPQYDRWRTKVTALFETKDFTKFYIEQLEGSLMTHALHLGVAVPENPKNRGLALKAEDQEDSEPDEEEAAMLARRMKRFHRSFKPGNHKGRNSGRKMNGSKSDQGCLKCGTGKDPSNEVSSTTLQTLSNNRLIELRIETLDNFKKLSIIKEQSDKALELSKGHITYLNNVRSKVQELSQYKLFNLSLDPTRSTEINMGVFTVDLERLNSELTTVKEQKEKLIKELALANAWKQSTKQLLSGLRLPNPKEQKKEEQAPKNENYVKKMWVRKADPIVEKELEETRVLGEIIAIGKVGRLSSHSIDNVFLVEGLMYSLLSISQFCDKGNSVSFTLENFRIINNDSKKVILEGSRQRNKYTVDLNKVPRNNLTCLSVIEEDPLLWHKRFGHASFSLLDKLRSKELVRGLPSIKFLKDKVCEACAKGKHVRSYFKPKNIVRTTKPLELIHMDLCGPMRIQSRSGKRYVLVIVDDYSRFTWVIFLTSKDETFDEFVAFAKKIQRTTAHQLIYIRSDHGTEFENHKFTEYCKEQGIDHNFSALRTPQKNGVVERKNRTLEDMARTMLIASSLPRNFWAEAVNTACYIVNRVMIRVVLNKTPYELLKGTTPNISYFRAFGCKCFIHNNGKRNLGKFDERGDEAVFLGYALNSKAYKVYNKRSMCVEESVHIIFDETNNTNEVQDQENFDIGLIRLTDNDEEYSPPELHKED
ncbi:uncharacterized protein [Spinacia oleracea]|uniref:Integrase catalytic domain-containing protein n=1 Tax=Spinacia oleracea TaxID=3562 RepID=A0ABM3R840_SPIOL|nr:uncharacterized protein LOC130467333 [Spinacia oleracea]